MLKYAICEIFGKQYKVIPGQPFLVDLKKDSSGMDKKETRKIEAKVLMSAEDSKLTTGTPYLDKKISLDILEEGLLKKIRVFKYHSKANYRKVRGSRRRVVKVVMSS